MIVSLIGRIHQYHWCSLDPKWIPHFLWIICTSWQRWTWILSPPATVVTRVFKGSSHWSVTYLQRIKRIKVSFVGRIIRFTSWSLSWSMLCILATGLTHPPTPQPLFADSAAMATAQDPYCLPSLSHIMLSFSFSPFPWSPYVTSKAKFRIQITSDVSVWTGYNIYRVIESSQVLYLSILLFIYRFRYDMQSQLFTEKTGKASVFCCYSLFNFKVCVCFVFPHICFWENVLTFLSAPPWKVSPLPC